MKFGDNLKLVRKSNKISQEELALRLGVSRQSVSKWETGENYPSMTNILCLCDIFKCKINELVHEDFTDINSLDDEIKMSVVKFKENEQKRMKGLSKAIYIIARIFKVVASVGMVSAIVLLIASLIIFPKSKFDVDNKKVSFYDKEYSYNINDNKFEVGNNEKKYGVFTFNDDEKEEVLKFIDTSTTYKVSFMITLCVSLFLSCLFLFRMLNNLEKLFLNIHDKDTPFDTNNVNYIKMIAINLLLYVLIPDVVGGIASVLFNLNLNIEVNMIDYLFVVVVITLAYIFKYGYEIQLDSKGKMYGKIDEEKN